MQAFGKTSSILSHLEKYCAMGAAGSPTASTGPLDARTVAPPPFVSPRPSISAAMRTPRVVAAPRMLSLLAYTFRSPGPAGSGPSGETPRRLLRGPAQAPVDQKSGRFGGHHRPHPGPPLR